MGIFPSLMPADTYGRYRELLKPEWAPPAEVFGPVWSVLYVIIFISFASALFLVVRKRAAPPIVALPFVLNAFFNLLFTPLQFALQNNVLASVDILLVLATLLWAMLSIWPYKRWIAYAQIPYLLWVCFATALQLTITAMNFPAS